MATLTGTQVRHSYDSLLKLNNNDGLSSGLKVVTDGLGTPSPLSLSELEVVSSVAVEATGFKTPTGTSAQVLLADGTVGSPQMTTMLTAHLDLSSSVSSSWYYIPFDGQLAATTKAYYHSIVAPFDGYVRGISYKGAGTGTATTATTLKYRLMRNGTPVYTSSSLSLTAGSSSSKSKQLNLTSASTATFDQLMRLEVQIQVNQPIHKSLFSIILQEDT